MTPEELLAELRRLHDELGTKPTTTIVRDQGIYSVPTYYNRFDSWGDALNAAFESVPDDTADNKTTDDANRAAQTYSDGELIEEINRVADVADADGAPSTQDFRDHSDIADTTASVDSARGVMPWRRLASNRTIHRRRLTKMTFSRNSVDFGMTSVRSLLAHK